MEAFDPKFFLDLFAQDEELIQHVISAFLGDSVGHLKDIETALDKKDATMLLNTAHKFKGELSFFGYKPALDKISKLEALGKSGATDGAMQLYEELIPSMQPIYDFAKNRKKGSV